MKKISGGGKRHKIAYIPARYIFAIALTVLEIAAIIGVVVALCYYVPYFYGLAILAQIGCTVSLVASDDNPEYKVPWLIIIFLLPIVGFMLYILFYSRKLKKKYVRRLEELWRDRYFGESGELLARLQAESPRAAAQARLISELSRTDVYERTGLTYFPLGEDMHAAMLKDIKEAKSFIFLEYFSVEEGVFWNSILELLKEKAAAGVDVRLVYDDIGCMTTLPGDYAKRLSSLGIDATPFSRLRGNANNEFNNRSHRKMLIIDGIVGYTGGVNISDRYINVTQPFGHWKDTGVRLEGDAVKEMTNLFYIDYGINKNSPRALPENAFPEVCDTESDGYVVPFGDGPRPLYSKYVAKSAIQALLATAEREVVITTPYLIIDNDMCQSLENAAMRGVDVKIIIPGIPDKRLVYLASLSFCSRLISAGVKIYRYTPGFIHAKSYIADGEAAIIGTINLDYRSLVHHFENGVWIYRSEMLSDMRRDLLNTLSESEELTADMLKASALGRLIKSVLRFLSPLL